MLKHVPLIIMSSESSDETFEQHRKLRTRAEDYVHKPIAFGELLQHIRTFGLRQQYHPRVVAEVGGQQFGVAIELQALPHECVEVLGQKVGEIERAEFGVGQSAEHVAAGKELVAVVAR